MDSEAVQAGVLWMTPVRKHPHLNYLEGLIILLLKVNMGNSQRMLADTKLILIIFNTLMSKLP